MAVLKTGLTPEKFLEASSPWEVNAEGAPLSDILSADIETGRVHTEQRLFSRATSRTRSVKHNETQYPEYMGKQ